MSDVVELNKVPVSIAECCDCMEFMARYADGFFDVCFTDFPYGNECDYSLYDDKKENTITLIKKAMPEILRVSKRAIITSGVKLMYEYPKPDWVGNWFTPQGVGRGSHGFCCWQPILIYGKDPYAGKGSRPDSMEWTGSIDEQASFHPCPKPIKFWQKLFKRWVGEDTSQKVFDPFIGSGTTRIVAYELGFDFYGSEIDSLYFEAQEKRFKEAVAMPLFDNVKAETKQSELFN